jgi:hypothetical protein
MNRKSNLTSLFAATLLLTIGLNNSPITQPQSALAHTPEQIAQSRFDAPVPLFDDLGNHTFPISSQNPQAQQYFDQGLILAYGWPIQI